MGREYARELSHAAMELHVSVRIHIKVDTGMSRIGFFYQQPERDEDSLGEMEKACRLPGFVPEGIFTHFAVADEGEEGEVYTRRQFENFMEAIRYLEERGISFSIRHCANSASIGEYPEFQLDMVRPGIILYGLMPSGKLRKPMDFKPVMTLKSVLSCEADRTGNGSELRLHLPGGKALGGRDNSRRVCGRLPQDAFRQGLCPCEGEAGSHSGARMHGSDDGGSDRYSAGKNRG